MKDHAIVFSDLHDACDVGLLLLISYCDPYRRRSRGSNRLTGLWRVTHLVNGRTKSQTTFPDSSGLPFPVFPVSSSSPVWTWDTRWHLCIADSPFPGVDQRQPSSISEDMCSEGPECLLLMCLCPSFTKECWMISCQPLNTFYFLFSPNVSQRGVYHQMVK